MYLIKESNEESMLKEQEDAENKESNECQILMHQFLIPAVALNVGLKLRCGMFRECLEILSSKRIKNILKKSEQLCCLMVKSLVRRNNLV